MNPPRGYLEVVCFHLAAKDQRVNRRIALPRGYEKTPPSKLSQERRLDVLGGPESRLPAASLGGNLVNAAFICVKEADLPVTAGKEGIAERSDQQRARLCPDQPKPRIQRKPLLEVGLLCE